MKIATSTGDFGFYCPNDAERIRELHRAGFRYIDLDMYSWKPDSVYLRDNWQEEVKKLKDLAAALGMQFVQAHSQGGNAFDPNPSVMEFITKATHRSIEICGMLGIKNTVLHAGFAAGLSKEEWFDKNKAFYAQFFPVMEQYGVNLLCENSATCMTREKYYINTGADMREFIQYVDHPLFHGCWDTGHANCEGSQYDQIMTLGDELYAIHYNDNQGDKDTHVAPFVGRMNHDEVINALIDVGFQGYFTLECGASLVKYDQWTGPRRRCAKEGIAPKLSHPQLFMQRHMEKMVYETARWMLETYDIFEE